MEIVMSLTLLGQATLAKPLGIPPLAETRAGHGSWSLASPASAP